MDHARVSRAKQGIRSTIPCDKPLGAHGLRDRSSRSFIDGGNLNRRHVNTVLDLRKVVRLGQCERTAGVQPTRMNRVLALGPIVNCEMKVPISGEALAVHHELGIDLQVAQAGRLVYSCVRY